MFMDAWLLSLARQVSRKVFWKCFVVVVIFLKPDFNQKLFVKLFLVTWLVHKDALWLLLAYQTYFGRAIDIPIIGNKIIINASRGGSNGLGILREGSSINTMNLNFWTDISWFLWMHVKTSCDFVSSGSLLWRKRVYKNITI